MGGGGQVQLWKSFLVTIQKFIYTQGKEVSRARGATAPLGLNVVL